MGALCSSVVMVRMLDQCSNQAPLGPPPALSLLLVDTMTSASIVPSCAVWLCLKNVDQTPTEPWQDWTTDMLTEMKEQWAKHGLSMEMIHIPLGSNSAYHNGAGAIFLKPSDERDRQIDERDEAEYEHRRQTGDEELRQILTEIDLELLNPLNHGEDHAAGPSLGEIRRPQFRDVTVDHRP